MAVDVIAFIGNNIRVRMGVSASLIAIRSFLACLVSLLSWGSLYDMDTDDGHKAIIAEVKYDSAIQGIAECLLFFCCVMILVIIMMGYGDNLNGSNNKKLNIWIRRIAGWVIIGATGMSLCVDYEPWYWLPAVCLLSYDVQYL